MTVVYVVIVGSFQGPPDEVIGPFDEHDDAVAFATAAPGDPAGRYAVVVPLTPPPATGEP